jgi:hypothetical protein
MLIMASARNKKQSRETCHALIHGKVARPVEQVTGIHQALIAKD